MKTNRWWYSKKQKEVIDFSNTLNRNYNHTCHVFVDGKWCEYTEWTTSPNGKCNWDDAILIAESEEELPLKIDGVEQQKFNWWDY